MPNETAHIPLKEVTIQNYGIYYVYPKGAFFGYNPVCELLFNQKKITFKSYDFDNYINHQCTNRGNKKDNRHC